VHTKLAEFLDENNGREQIQEHIHSESHTDNDVFQQFCLRASASSSDSDEEGKMIWREKDEWKINFSGEKPATPLLDTINYPAHMMNLSSQVSFRFLKKK
jgi:hypothetical protein